MLMNGPDPGGPHGTAARGQEKSLAWDASSRIHIATLSMALSHRLKLEDAMELDADNPRRQVTLSTWENGMAQAVHRLGPSGLAASSSHSSVASSGSAAASPAQPASSGSAAATSVPNIPGARRPDLLEQAQMNALNALDTKEDEEL